MVLSRIGNWRSASKNGFVRNNSLTLVCFALFAIFVVGQFFAGLRDYNADQKVHNQPELSLGEYATSGAFWEALSENWESEYLQMASYVILTVFLIQKGSSESKDPDKQHAVDQDPAQADKRGAPWPVRRGGLWLRLYQNSLFLVFLALFLASFVTHAFSGARVQRRATRARRAPREHHRVCAALPVLVRVVPELAERVPRRRIDRPVLGLAPAARLTRIEAGARSAFGDRDRLRPVTLEAKARFAYGVSNGRWR